MKDTIWAYLEQYDLPVVVGSLAGSTATMPLRVFSISHYLVTHFVNIYYFLELDKYLCVVYKKL